MDGKTLREDERAVSPVIGVILMIAITVVIAAVVAAFAYGIIGGVSKSPNSALVVEDAQVDSTNVTIIHHGGDTITDAYNSTDVPIDWDSITVKYNGANIPWADVVEGGDNDANFESGEQLKVKVTALVSGDTISVIYIPSGDIMQRVKVA